MEKMGKIETEVEELFDQKKRVKNPFVPIGAILTAGVLTAGLISFRQGNSLLGQKLMRDRVVVQGATVALMVALLTITGRNFNYFLEMDLYV
ncbi:RING-H2 finger protein ATL48-like [Telopea speciosissima]|uniref:RING-H2 finger protein ATL48-like n=1 Tax=Telopea speciosissima TaxID=54955 RepID=UPI001CC64011|nr:RING-H2 finger protein ATL48-like [Telopea speciosissima]